MKNIKMALTLGGLLVSGGLGAAPTMTPEQIAEYAMQTPVLNTYPSVEYSSARRDYGMTIGLEQSPGGRLWACWVGGGDSADGFFVIATSDDEGITWSEPRLVIDPHDKSLPAKRRTLVGNLWTDPTGRLWLFFDQGMNYFDGRLGLWAATCENPDADNPAWSTPRRIWDGCALNKPIVLANGDWLMVASIWNRERAKPPFDKSFAELDTFRMANILASSDQGLTWERRGGVRFKGPSFDESHLIERKDGFIWLTTRTNGGIFESTSKDGGRTWGPPVKSAIGHIDSRHHMRRLASGRLLLVKHGLLVDERTPTRSHLSAFLSDDDGFTWKGGLLLDGREKVSYPDGFQAADGSLFISYDFDRDHRGEILMARFTEADVLAGKLQIPKSRLRMLISHPEGLTRRMAAGKWTAGVLAELKNQKSKATLGAAEAEALRREMEELRQALRVGDLERVEAAYVQLGISQAALKDRLGSALKILFAELDGALPEIRKEISLSPN